MNCTFLKDNMKLNIFCDKDQIFKEVANLVCKKYAINKEREEPYFIFNGQSIDINSNKTIEQLGIHRCPIIQVVIGGEVIGGR